MLLKTEDILADIADRCRLSRAELDDVRKRIADGKETEIHVGDSIVIPDIHQVAENALDLEKRIYLLNLEPTRQTHTKNLHGMLMVLRSLGMAPLTRDFLRGLSEIDPQLTPAFAHGDNWISLGLFFQAANLLATLMGSSNPRAFLTYGSYGALDDWVARYTELQDGFSSRRSRLSLFMDRVLIRLLRVEDIIGLLCTKIRVLNYDIICQHLSTVPDTRADGEAAFQTHYRHKYFENFRGDMEWLHEWWAIGCYCGVVARKNVGFPKCHIRYFADDLVGILENDYAAHDFQIASASDNPRVLLLNGKEIARQVLIRRKEMACQAGFLVRRFSDAFPSRRTIYSEAFCEVDGYSEHDVAEMTDSREFALLWRCCQTVFDDHNEAIVRDGEMFNAPYTYLTFDYGKKRVVHSDLPLEIQDEGTSSPATRDHIERANLRASLRLRFVELQKATESERHHRRLAEKERDESDRKSRIFEKYTRRSLVKRVDQGEDPTNDASSLIQMAVLFTDIRNFTPFSESMDPDEIVGFLNNYFDRMNKPIITCRGEIDKLMGDCIMAGFHDGADPEASVKDAVEAAVRIRRELQALNRERWEAFQRQEAGEGSEPFTRINNGVGITFGEVVRGNIGSSDKLDHTLIGDVVNAGQRLEALTKDFGLAILVSEDVARRLGNGYRTRFIDRVRVKGKSRALTVYEVFDHEPDRIAELKLANEPRMREAYTAYFAGHFEDALAVYEDLREEAGRHSYLSGMCADPVLDFYARRCRALIHRRDAKLLDLETWDGVYNVLDEVPSEKAIPITKLGQIVLQQETMEGNSLEYLLDKELTETRKFTRAEAGTVYVVDETGQLRFGYFQNDAMPLDLERISRTLTSNRTIPVNEESIAGYVALTGETLHLPDVYQLPAGVPYRFEAGFDHESGYRTKSMLCVPIRDIHGKVLGVLQLINAKNRELVVEFSEEDIAYARFFAHFTANAIKRAEENRRKLLDMAAMVESYDRDETGRHNTRVGEYAAELYQQWAVSRGLSEREILTFKDRLRLGAMLHDAGKIGISTAVLNKPGKLTEEEFGLMQTHTVNSTNYFHDKEESPWSEVAANIALYHHEKWDGTGYPERLSGEAIPLCAQVVAVADVYDALVSKRSYKDGMPHDKARQIVVDGSGSHFDPQMVEAFVRIEDVVRDIRERYA